MKETKPKTRCAIYTRKSSEEGLEMEFNSLDAQREAGEAYIFAQKHEGWELLADNYDDGGFSGGSMERPALQRLLKDIRRGLIDVVVVYKVDRLSRSLSDFSKLIELFDEHKVSFVSVTQQFNTTSSMGRLTLNILFSFAQFEREVIAERIRDKFAASKSKGIWMGGTTPLGYEVKDRQLLIKQDDAEIVSMIFNQFIELGSVTVLTEKTRSMGICSKQRMLKSGKTVGGTLLCKNSIYNILNNPIYIGKIKHKDKIYDGRHEAIISKEIWDKVHDIMQISPRDRGAATKRKTPAALIGLLKCSGCSSSMTPCYSRKKSGKLYRYYAASAYKKGQCKACPIRQIAANEIESIVVQQLQLIFNTPEMIMQTWKEVSQEAHDISEMDVRSAFADLLPIWNELFPKEQERLLQLLLEQVVVYPDWVDVRVKAEGLNSLVRELNYKTNSTTLRIGEKS